jgi:fermentation-respiration switch protein FrsA (DUF1100 family)
MKLAIGIILAGYAFVCLLALVLHRRIVFQPMREIGATPADIGLAFRDVQFAGPGGRRLHGWYVPAENAHFTLLYCHGNAGNIGHRVESIRAFVQRGLSVFIFDYEGYGRSQGKPSEAATYADARAAYDHLVETEGLPPERIVLFGRSLGTAVAIELATRVRHAGMVLESSFTSAREVGARMYPWLPMRYLVRVHYDAQSLVADVSSPKLFVHSLEDEMVPFGMGRRLYNRANRPKTLVRVRGGHNDVYLLPGSEYESALEAFLDELKSESRPEVVNDAGEGE